MQIRDIMTRALTVVHMDDSLDHIKNVFDEHGFHHLIVVEEHQIVGVISDRDLLKHLSPFIGNPLLERSQDINTLKKRAHQIMRRKPVIAREDWALSTAAALLLRERVSCLPVVDHADRPKGIVTWRDLMPHCFTCDTNSGEAA